METLSIKFSFKIFLILCWVNLIVVVMMYNMWKTLTKMNLRRALIHNTTLSCKLIWKFINFERKLPPNKSKANLLLAQKQKKSRQFLIKTCAFSFQTKLHVHTQIRAIIAEGSKQTLKIQVC